MVSLHKALTESPKTQANIAEFQALPKKRSWEETLTKEFFKDHTDAEKRKPIFDIELHLKTPLPSDKWQQYLSIQSGKIHLCNTTYTRMDMKTPGSESRCGPQFKTLPEHEEASLGQMSLDLELNLTCESVKKIKKVESYDMTEMKKNSGSLLIESSKNKKDSCVLTQTPSWLSSEGDDHNEMIAAVCMRCHLLVMLCKSSPSCPNCKFMHPPDQSPSQFLKRRRFSLLC